MQQSPSSESKTYPATQEVPNVLRNQIFITVFITARQGSLLWATWIHLTQLLNLFPKIHSSITFPSTLRSSEWSLPFRFSYQNFVYISPFSHAWYITNSMEQSTSWEANSHSANQEIPCLLYNRKFVTIFVGACHWSLSWDTYEGVSKRFRTESITKYTLTIANTRRQQNSLDWLTK
jgi:hypothetical protein